MEKQTEVKLNRKKFVCFGILFYVTAIASLQNTSAARISVEASDGMTTSAGGGGVAKHNGSTRRNDASSVEVTTPDVDGIELQSIPTTEGAADWLQIFPSSITQKRFERQGVTGVFVTSGGNQPVISSAPAPAPAPAGNGADPSLTNDTGSESILNGSLASYDEALTDSTLCLTAILQVFFVFSAFLAAVYALGRLEDKRNVVQYAPVEKPEERKKSDESDENRRSTRRRRRRRRHQEDEDADEDETTTHKTTKVTFPADDQTAVQPTPQVIPPVPEQSLWIQDPGYPQPLYPDPFPPPGFEIDPGFIDEPIILFDDAHLMPQFDEDFLWSTDDERRRSSFDDDRRESRSSDDDRHTDDDSSSSYERRRRRSDPTDSSSD